MGWDEAARRLNVHAAKTRSYRQMMVSMQVVHSWRVKHRGKLLPDKLSEEAAHELANELAGKSDKEATVCVHFSSGSIEERVVYRPGKQESAPKGSDRSPRTRLSGLAAGRRAA